jgi:ribosomal protein L11 methyltransferase
VRWLELIVTVDAEAVEPVSEILARLGHGTAVRPTRLIRDSADELFAREDPTAPYEVTAHLPDDDQAPARLDSTRRALWHLQAFGLRPISQLHVRPVDDTDWTEAWREGYAAQRIGRIVVVPSWIDEPLAPDELELRLDPGMAFGTGLHPTTRACLRLLQEVGPMPPVVLDVGSGSGILALAALRLGAGHAVCLDTDPAAVAATRENAERNGLGGQVTALSGTLPASPADGVRYRLITANLVASMLVDLADALSAHAAPGGALLAAGVIAERGEEVETALTRAGFDTVGRDDDGEWVALRMTRRG